MSLRNKWNSYLSDPFGFLDNVSLKFRGGEYNIFRKSVAVRRGAFLFAMTCLGCWIVFGFDSSPFQFMYPLFMTKNSILQSLFFQHRLPSMQTLVDLFNYGYGKEMHYSAFVIYGLMFWALSRHFDKNLGITKSQNIAYSCSLTFLSIAVFEFFWMGCYSYFQHQPWIITPMMPQLRIHLQNIAFLSVGAIGTLQIWGNSLVLDKGKLVGRLYRFRLNWKAVLLIACSVATALFWIYYPFHVDKLNVTLANGQVWTNSQQFPQTLYTIDLNPNDNINAGEWFWVENNLIHGLNTLVKVCFTLTIGYVGMVKKLIGSKELDQK